jgi:hypothetical protein
MLITFLKGYVVEQSTATAAKSKIMRLSAVWRYARDEVLANNGELVSKEEKQFLNPIAVSIDWINNFCETQCDRIPIAHALKNKAQAVYVVPYENVYDCCLIFLYSYIMLILSPYSFVHLLT